MNPRNKKGGVKIRGRIYVYVSGKTSYQRRARVIAEKALGYPLPEHAEIHHVNEVKTDDSNTNLVICQDHQYHTLLHVRARIIKAGGDPNSQAICSKCQALKPKEDFNRAAQRPVTGIDSYCKACRYDRTRVWVFAKRGFGTRENLSCAKCGHIWNPQSLRLPKSCPNPTCRTFHWRAHV